MSDEAYGGLLGAFPYAARRSPSWLFRSYAVVAGLVTALVTLVVAAAVVRLIGETASLRGGTVTLSRALFVLVGVFAVTPLVAPVLLVARRHRRGAGDGAYDRTLALGGYLFVASLYAGLVASVPPAQQEAPPAAVAPVVETLYALPPVAGLAFPVIGAAAVAAAHRLARGRASGR